MVFHLCLGILLHHVHLHYGMHSWMPNARKLECPSNSFISKKNGPQKGGSANKTHPNGYKEKAAGARA